jgi:hypothetical protein
MRKVGAKSSERGEYLREYFTIPEDEVYPLAERFFLKAAGFDHGNGKHRRMYEEAQRVRAGGLRGIRVEGFTDAYGADAYDGGAVTAGGRRIAATVFGRVPAGAVRQVILYVITAGECGVPDDADLMTQLYAHMWGTAYVDAGRIILEDRIRDRIAAGSGAAAESGAAGGANGAAGASGRLLSPAFSPGFYGMDNRDNAALVDLLGAGDIGVSCADTGTMLPIKTCSGIFLVTDGSVDFPGDECLACIAGNAGCADCMIANRKALDV